MATFSLIKYEYFIFSIYDFNQIEIIYIRLNYILACVFKLLFTHKW